MSFFKLKDLIEKLKKVYGESRTLFFAIFFVTFIAVLVEIVLDAGLIWCGFYALHSVFEKIPSVSFGSALWLSIALRAFRIVLLKSGGDE